MTRRVFLKDLGLGTFAVAVLGMTVVSSAGGSGESRDATTWTRVALGGVSAYLLSRRGEVLIVDTGNPGDAGAIEATLISIGSGWDDVAHVVLTHLHGDHIGSLGPVMEAAPAATGYAGEPDIPSIPSPRPLAAVGDGDSVFGMDIIAAPGHTAGSIVVLDPVGEVLVAGDALRTDGGEVIGANPRFTEDMDEANRSIAKLAEFGFETVLVGHGDPITDDGTARVAALAAELN